MCHGIAVGITGGPGKRRIGGDGRSTVGWRSISWRRGGAVPSVVVLDRHHAFVIADEGADRIADDDHEILVAFSSEIANDRNLDRLRHLAGLERHRAEASEIVATRSSRAIERAVVDGHGSGAGAREANGNGRLNHSIVSFRDHRILDGKLYLRGREHLDTHFVPGGEFGIRPASRGNKNGVTSG